MAASYQEVSSPFPDAHCQGIILRYWALAAFSLSPSIDRSLSQSADEDAAQERQHGRRDVQGPALDSQSQLAEQDSLKWVETQ